MVFNYIIRFDIKEHNYFSKSKLEITIQQVNIFLINFRN